MSQRISLDGDWQLAFFPEAESPIRHPDDLAAHAGQVIAARVPGNVELDLQAAGHNPGAVLRQQYPAAAASMNSTNGGTRKTFEVSGNPEGLPAEGARYDLVFAGLDTLATVWLNGIEIGRAANALIEHRFDVTDALRPGTNRIVVRLGSAVNHARQFSYDAASMSWEHREEGLFIRKAPHVWGWDIMPRAVSAGIWRSVWIEERPATAIEQMYYWTAGVNAEGATLGVRFQIRTDAPTTDGFWLRFQGDLRPCDQALPEVPAHGYELHLRLAPRIHRRRLPHPRAGRPALVAEGLRRAEPLHGDGATGEGRAGRRRTHRPHRHPQGGRGSHRDRRRGVGAGGGRWRRAPDGCAGRSRQPLRLPRQRRADHGQGHRTGCRSTRSTAATPSGWIGPWRSSPTWAAT